MKAATASEIKQGLRELDKKALVELTLRLARFKKENKELLTYLLFEAGDLTAYIQTVKEEMNEGMAGLNPKSIYLAKKTIRKVLRIANKHIRYTGEKRAEAEILMHYLSVLGALALSWRKNTALVNLYKGQLKKVKVAIGTMHEDLQWEYQKQLEALEL